jgi:hypothetical protein
MAHTGSVLGTSLVARVLAHTTILLHLDEVESTVQAARKLGDINIEGELLSDDVEHLVLGVGGHEVGTATNVGRVGTLGDEFEGQSIAAGGDTVGSRVVSTVDSTVGSAGLAVLARSSIPRVVGILSFW